MNLGTNASCRGASLLYIVGDDTLPADVAQDMRRRDRSSKTLVDELTVGSQRAQGAYTRAQLKLLSFREKGKTPETIKQCEDAVGSYLCLVVKQA
ncbi:MAG: hypothetical protein ACLPXZ_08785 [Mycobacterium sp.]